MKLDCLRKTGIAAAVVSLIGISTVFGSTADAGPGISLQKKDAEKIYQEFCDVLSVADPVKWDRFKLIDLDGDGVFELFATCIDGRREDPGIQPYVIIGHNDAGLVLNDELYDVVAGAGGYRGILSYLEGKGKLHESMVFAPFGEPADRVYSLKDGKIEETGFGEFTADRSVDMTGDDWDLFKNGDWTWNGRTVTEEEYNKNLKEATDHAEGKALCETDWQNKDAVLAELKSLMSGGGLEGEDQVGEPYCGVLYWYKELQDSGKSWEEMEKYSSRTALVQHGWPYATNNEEVRYVYQDITGDGSIELIITYYNTPVDIYSNDGDAVYAYGVPYRALADIYPDGSIMEGLTLGVQGWRKTWYRYNNESFRYDPVTEDLHPEVSALSFPEGKKISDVVVPESLKGIAD